jgi:hypothetical protein
VSAYKQQMRDAWILRLATISPEERVSRAIDFLMEQQEALEEALGFVEGQEDVVDGDYGIPEGNEAMRIARLLREAIAIAKARA